MSVLTIIPISGNNFVQVIGEIWAQTQVSEPPFVINRINKTDKAEQTLAL